MWTISELKEKGKANFKKNYWPCVVAALILGLSTVCRATSAGGQGGKSGNTAIIIGVSLVSLILSLVVLPVLEVGCRKFFIDNSWTEKPALSVIGMGFNGSVFGNVFVTQLLKTIFITLWSLLLIVPGIIKYYEYRMVPYILAEHPEMERKEIFARSKEMMNGNKMNAFMLDLSFLGWMILTALTAGIVGLLYMNPYKAAVDAELYEEIKSIRGN